MSCRTYVPNDTRCLKIGIYSHVSLTLPPNCRAHSLWRIFSRDGAPTFIRFIVGGLRVLQTAECRLLSRRAHSYFLKSALLRQRGCITITISHYDHPRLARISINCLVAFHGKEEISIFIRDAQVLITKVVLKKTRLLINKNDTVVRRAFIVLYLVSMGRLR